MKHFVSKPDYSTAAFLISRQHENLNASLQVYNALKNKSISVISAMIDVYKMHNQSEEVKKMCREMIYVHREMRKEGKKVTTWDWDKLIQTLCKCQWYSEAIHVFQQMTQEEKEPHPATVYVILKSLVQMKNLEYITTHVIPLIDRCNMQIAPHIYSEIIKLCSQVAHAEYGEVVHAHLMKIEIKSNPYINNSLVTMYSKVKNIQ